MTAVVSVSLIERLEADDRVGKGVEQCWLDVGNAGGSVVFPSLPVSNVEVSEASRRLPRDVAATAKSSDGCRCVSTALTSQVTRGTVERLQSRPERRGRWIGNQLMRVLCQLTRSLGLEQLRLVIRGGARLEGLHATDLFIVKGPTRVSAVPTSPVLP